MKWRIKTVPEEPRLGQRRVVIRFLWLPTECTDGYIRWLTRVRVLQEFATTSRVEGDMHDGLTTHTYDEWTDLWFKRLFRRKP